MNKKRIPFYIIIVVLILINGYYYILPLFKSSPKNLENVHFELALNSEDLVSNFITNEENANKLYAGKIIEIEGFVKEVSFLNNRNTVILYSENKASGVICDVNPNQIEKIKQLKQHQKIKVKGICKGFLKDVILLNCHIDTKPNE